MLKVLQRILAAPVLGECRSSGSFIAAAPADFTPGSAGNVPGAAGRGAPARRCAPEFVIPALLCFLSGSFRRESSFGKVRSSWRMGRLRFCWELRTSLGHLCHLPCLELPWGPSEHQGWEHSSFQESRGVLLAAIGAMRLPLPEHPSVGDALALFRYFEGFFSP